MLGFHRSGDAGGGRFYWNAESTSDDDGGAIIRPDGALEKGRWVREYSGPVNPRWFGAVGDGSGKTAKEMGVDALKASWNQWPSWATGDYSPQFLVDMKQQPFDEYTSYDQIGIQLALWHVGEGRGEVAIPAGKYAMTSALFYHNGMRASLSGAGLYQTILTAKPSCVNDRGLMAPHCFANKDAHSENVLTLPVPDRRDTFSSLEPISEIIGRGLVVSLSWNDPESVNVSTYATITGNSFNRPGAINLDLSKGHVLSGNVFPGP